MRTSNLMKAILGKVWAEEEAEKARHEERIRRAIAAGPPKGSGVTLVNWTSWLRYRFFACSDRPDHTCTAKACAYGSRCTRMAAKGMLGTGEVMPRKARPACGARTRTGGACAMKVEPGKNRCRLHGGKSTGPTSAEGRARIAEATRQRWARRRQEAGKPRPGA